MQGITLCISTTMVLILLGLVVLTGLTARNTSAYVREHLTVTVMLTDTLSSAEGKAFAKALEAKPYAKQVTYISKEQALKEQTEAMGSDPSEFLGVNPFMATLEMQVQADYANNVSLHSIVKALKAHRREVAEVNYQEDLTESVNRNLQQASMVLLALAVLLLLICYSLIANTVRLSVYSRRFTIHTMKLVGASWAFIRWPFVRQTLGIGFVASLLACGALGAAAYGLYRYQPGIEEVVGVAELAVAGVAVICLGMLLTGGCAWLSVNKFLRMTAGELYKI